MEIAPLRTPIPRWELHIPLGCTLVSRIETVPNKHTDLNKYTGWKFFQNKLNIHAKNCYLPAFLIDRYHFSLENVPRKHTEEQFF